jgi:hypothetical protein
MGIKIKHNGTDVILEELTLPELEQLFIDTRKLISVIEEQLEYPLLLADDSKRTPDVAGATFALKNYRAAIPVIEQAIAARPQRAEHPTARTGRHRRCQEAGQSQGSTNTHHCRVLCRCRMGSDERTPIRRLHD